MLRPAALRASNTIRPYVCTLPKSIAEWSLLRNTVPYIRLLPASCRFCLPDALPFLPIWSSISFQRSVSRPRTRYAAGPSHDFTAVSVPKISPSSSPSYGHGPGLYLSLAHCAATKLCRPTTEPKITIPRRLQRAPMLTYTPTIFHIIFCIDLRIFLKN